MAEKNCSKEKNKKKCNCTYESCPRKGICCECIEYHWFSSKELPACFFTKDAEKTYDRSLENFLKTWSKK
ncbi:MAG: DUF6485 family protein [Elusimicrobia bacterium]|nr:DUF6485 family protein [Elusimicrobiota bacterium]